MASYKIMPFFGFMGSSGVTDIKKGKDKDRSFELVAQTIQRMSTTLYPAGGAGQLFPPIKSWTYRDMFTALMFGILGGTVGEIHIATHGGESRLSLAYQFDKGKRIRDRAKKFNKLAKKIGDKAAALQALDEEDGLWSGTMSMLSSDKDNWRTKATGLIRANMDPKGYVHIWGCYAGGLTCNPSDDGDPVLDAYFKRFKLRDPCPGVARDMAMALGVPVTAAQLLPDKEKGGLSFWIRKQDGKLVRTSERAQQVPMWLWPDKNAKWVTYKPDGSISDKIRLFANWFEPKDLPAGRLPEFLSVMYGK